MRLAGAARVRTSLRLPSVRSIWVDLDTFTDRLREGLMSDHPDMPTFRFTREDERSIQGQ
jgi:hypothetical protein